MSTLSQYYKQKEQNGTGTTVKKTFMVPFEELYTVEGEQGRPLNKEHAEKMCELWMSGTDLPALLVEVTERGVKIIDGQHRHYGAHLAREKGHQIPRIECKDFIGTPLEKLAIQTGSSEGLQITPIERAINYNKAKNQGHSIQEIAKAFHRSVTDVENHLQLLSSGDTLLDMVSAGEVSATTAMELSKKHGPAAGRIATEQLEKVKASGKKKLTRSAAIVSPVKLREKIRAEHAAWSQETFGDVGPVGPLKHLAKEAMEAAEAPDDLSEWADLQFLLWDAMRRAGITEEELNSAMELKLSVNKARNWPEPKDGEPREQLKADSQEAVQPEKDYGDDLPLLKHEILEQSGVEAWACVIAAFKMKAEYTYSESKWAHTWAADSVENPTCVTVPAETIAKAVRLIKEHHDDLELKLWVSEQYNDQELAIEQLQRFSAVLIDVRQDKPCTVLEFIALVEQTNRDCWLNIRMLRQAVREVVGQMTIPDLGATG
ncbi:dATP/dGTP pyrophosphohydrolase domain-containing protein [Pantoea agglomerans]|uniref:dATP/dGTP pyrophosphohydrolase domain-containing protein n=1 Tax=Enterobacter agglomerans TaxID=549 RepID=UPI0032084605